MQPKQPEKPPEQPEQQPEQPKITYPKTLPDDTVPVDKVLLDTWIELIKYDKKATEDKNASINLRKYIILITFLASVLSATMLVLSSNWGMNHFAIRVGGFMAFALPLIGSSYLLFTKKYFPSVEWIQYRYVAERLRHHIYLYRAGAGEYHDLPQKLRDNKLSQNVAELTELFSVVSDNPKSNLNTPDYKNLSNREKHEYNYRLIREALWKRTEEDDDGFSTPIKHKTYVMARVDQQVDWYTQAVERDYERSKDNYRNLLIITTILTLITFAFWMINVQFVVFVSLSNAWLVAATALDNVKLVGKSYTIFKQTATKLQSILRERISKWNDTDNASDIDESIVSSDFVEQIEATLMNELDEWYYIATETQLTNDKSMDEQANKNLAEYDKIANLRMTGILNQFKQLPAEKRNEEIEKFIAEAKKLKTNGGGRPKPPDAPQPTD